MIHFRNVFSDLNRRVSLGCCIFLGLDYDGTLIELVSSPEDGKLPEDLKFVLKTLMTVCKKKINTTWVIETFKTSFFLN